MDWTQIQAENADRTPRREHGQTRSPKRRQDLLDVVELINAGADVRRVRVYLERYGGDLVAVFDGLVEEALAG